MPSPTLSTFEESDVFKHLKALCQNKDSAETAIREAIGNVQKALDESNIELPSGAFHFFADKKIVITPDKQILHFKSPLEGRGQDAFAGWFKDANNNTFLLKFDDAATCIQEATMTADFLPKDYQQSINVPTLGFITDENEKIVGFLTLQKRVDEKLFKNRKKPRSESPVDVTFVEQMDKNTDSSPKQRSSSTKVAKISHEVVRLTNEFSDDDRSPKSLRSFEYRFRKEIMLGLNDMSNQEIIELASIYFANTAMRNESVHTGQVMVVKENTSYTDGSHESKNIGFSGIDFGARNRFFNLRMLNKDLTPDETSEAYANSSNNFLGFHQVGKNYLTLMLRNKKLRYAYTYMWAHSNPEKIANAEINKFDAELAKIPPDSKEIFLNAYLESINAGCTEEQKIKIPSHHANGTPYSSSDKVDFVRSKAYELSLAYASTMQEKSALKIGSLSDELINDKYEFREINHLLQEKNFSQIEAIESRGSLNVDEIRTSDDYIPQPKSTSFMVNALQNKDSSKTSGQRPSICPSDAEKSTTPIAKAKPSPTPKNLATPLSGAHAIGMQYHRQKEKKKERQSISKQESEQSTSAQNTSPPPKSTPFSPN